MNADDERVVIMPPKSTMPLRMRVTEVRKAEPLVVEPLEVMDDRDYDEEGQHK